MRYGLKILKPYPLPRPGNFMEWYHKKKAIEDAGMKYVHAIEAYLKTTLSENVRDNLSLCFDHQELRWVFGAEQAGQ